MIKKVLSNAISPIRDVEYSSCSDASAPRLTSAAGPRRDAFIKSAISGVQRLVLPHYGMSFVKISPKSVFSGRASLGGPLPLPRRRTHPGSSSAALRQSRPPALALRRIPLAAARATNFPDARRLFSSSSRKLNE